jgi:hypothetical protein
VTRGALPWIPPAQFWPLPHHLDVPREVSSGSAAIKPSICWLNTSNPMYDRNAALCFAACGFAPLSYLS